MWIKTVVYKAVYIDQEQLIFNKHDFFFKKAIRFKEKYLLRSMKTGCMHFPMVVYSYLIYQYNDFEVFINGSVYLTVIILTSLC